MTECRDEMQCSVYLILADAVNDVCADSEAGSEQLSLEKSIAFTGSLSRRGSSTSCFDTSVGLLLLGARL